MVVTAFVRVIVVIVLEVLKLSIWCVVKEVVNVVVMVVTVVLVVVSLVVVASLLVVVG